MPSATPSPPAGLRGSNRGGDIDAMDDPTPNAARSGLLVTFEGGEGTGKSTQVDRLAAWLRSRGRDVTTAIEPGTTQVGEAVREILLETAPDSLAPEAELALYLAARAELVAEIVRPALERGEVVLLDRYADSSVAYQGYGRGLEPGRVRELCDFATGGLVPDLTVLIDLPVDEGLGRQSRPDRLERAGRDFHERVRRGYRELALNDAERFVVVDGRETMDDIQAEIRDRVAPLLAARAPQRQETS